MNATPIENVDNAFATLLKANAAEPYVHAEYERCDNIFKAHLMIYAEGDAAYASALNQAFHESHEDLAWYITAFTKEQLMDMFPHPA